MYFSKYLPVKVFSTVEASVHTDEQVYPWRLLKEAYDHLTGEPSDNVVINNGNICFKSDPDVRWFMHDIVNAYELFQVARESKFTFYPIKDTNGTISLYTSSTFKEHRLLVDAFTMRTVIVTKPTLVKKLSNMVDRKFPTRYLLRVFQYAESLEKGYKNYLDGWIVNPNDEDGYMCVNPLTALYDDNGIWYNWGELAELEKIVYKGVTETERFVLRATLVTRTDLTVYTPMSLTWCKYVVDLWHKLRDRNRSYIDVIDSDTYGPAFYVSGDLNHFISAETGEHITVKNKSFKEVLQSCVKNVYIDTRAYNTLWDVLRYREGV